MNKKNVDVIIPSFSWEEHFNSSNNEYPSLDDKISLIKGEYNYSISKQMFSMVYKDFKVINYLLIEKIKQGHCS